MSSGLGQSESDGGLVFLSMKGCLCSPGTTHFWILGGGVGQGRDEQDLQSEQGSCGDETWSRCLGPWQTAVCLSVLKSVTDL